MELFLIQQAIHVLVIAGQRITICRLSIVIYVDGLKYLTKSSGILGCFIISLRCLVSLVMGFGLNNFVIIMNSQSRKVFC